MNEKTVFLSNVGFQDAVFQAKMAGYVPVGRARNKKGQYVVFGRRGGYN